VKDTLYNIPNLIKQKEVKMDATTNSYYKIEEDEHNRWVSNKDDARREFYDEIRVIQLKFEHLINHDHSTLSVNNAQEVGNGLNEMDDLVFYKYNDPYDETDFEYDFRHELKVVKSDELGMEV